MALTALRNVFWYKPARPDLEPRRARTREYADAVLAARANTLTERLARPSVAELYAGQRVLVTGASGFMGRVLLEALLRGCPDIGSVYIILRAKKGVSPQDRLKDLTAVPLFDRLRSERPGALAKLVVLPGDTMEMGLGLSPEHRDLVQREVSFVFHLAASVRFDDPFQKAVFVNVRSSREVVDLARGMAGIKALVHVSTAYTNLNQDPVENVVYPTEHDWRDAIHWAERLDEDSLLAVDCLGHKMTGFHFNSYTYTKALAERVMEDAAKELPVIITRPSIVGPSIVDPMPGWIDNLMGMGGFWAAGLKGILRVGYGPNTLFDSMPVDVATKSIVLASWSRALGLRLCPDERVDVVTVAAGLGLAMPEKDLIWAVSEDGVSPLVPFPGAVRVPYFSTTNCWPWYQMLHWYHHVLFGASLHLLEKASGRKPRVMKVFRTLTSAVDTVSGFRGPFNFQPQKMWQLQGMMHPRDEKDLGLDMLFPIWETWDNYLSVIVNTVRGILKYTLKEVDDPVENTKARNRLRVVMRVYHMTMAVLFTVLVVGCFKLRTVISCISRANADTDADHYDAEQEDSIVAPIWSGVFNISQVQSGALVSL